MRRGITIKDILILCVIGVVIAFIVNGVDIQSVDDYYRSRFDVISEESETVFLSICCSVVHDNLNSLDSHLKDEKYIPADGVMLPLTEYVLHPKETVFDIMERAARLNGIQIVHRGGSLSVYNSVYMQGINHLFEYSCGPLSGWMYSINGAFPSYGCSAYELRDGDVIEWRYTCDLGRDIGAGIGGWQI